MSGFKIGYKRYTMSLLYTFKEFYQKEPVYHIGFQVFRFFLVFWRSQNSNPGGHKTSTFIDKVHYTLHPLIRLINTNTKAKDKKNMSQCEHPKKIFEVSFVASGMEKMLKFFCFCPQIYNNNKTVLGHFAPSKG